MKATLKKATPNPEQSFNTHKDIGHAMLSAWHYHPECELLVLKRTYGTCLIGDHVGPFKNGDVFLFVSNLPHTFRGEKKYLDRDDEKIGETIVILFQNNIWGDAFLNLPEINPIVKLLNTSKLGLRLKGATRKKVAKIAEEMLLDSPARKLINLLSALELIAASKEYELISSSGFNPEVNQVDQSRINTIFEYTFSNYHRKVVLEDVAAIINMGKHSFCRYFKSHTHKTYSQFLIELKVGHACKLLIENKVLIKQLCYESGFNNFASFHKFFKQITGKSPLNYQKEFMAQAS